MKKILLLLANGYETYEASVFIDVLGWNFVDGDKSTKLYSCAITKEVHTSFGQRSLVDFTLNELNLDDYDALAIPGGFDEYGYYDDAYSPAFLEVIWHFNAKAKTIASICVAALAVGRSGALAGRTATTYGMDNSNRQQELAGYGVTVLDQAIVEDGNIITSWNPATAMRVAFLLLERLTSKQNADEIKRIMGFEV